MQLIELRNLYKTYYLGEISVPVLRGVSLAIAQGEYVALMGSSGSGKSTLMNIIGCLDRQTTGDYYLEGALVQSLTPDQCAQLRNQKIGFVFQSFNLLRRTSALHNVMMPMTYATGISEKDAKRRAMELLERVGLASRHSHEPSQLSGGQQQRVAIARALVNRPAILLADEPTGNLDSSTSEDILTLFNDLHRSGTTILLVTHEDDVAKHATRVIRMSDGQIGGGGNEV